MKKMMFKMTPDGEDSEEQKKQIVATIEGQSFWRVRPSDIPLIMSGKLVAKAKKDCRKCYGTGKVGKVHGTNTSILCTCAMCGEVKEEPKNDEAVKPAAPVGDVPTESSSPSTGTSSNPNEPL